MNYKSNIGYRKELLTRLLETIIVHENEIISALKADFNKPEFEAVVTETSYVISDLKHTIKNLSRWAKPKRVFPFVVNIPSSDYIYKEPYGKVLIISPWNYPFQLALCPLIAAVAAGNQVLLKPSELTPNTAAIIQKIISKVFSINHVEVIQGDASVATQLLEQRWDYIFFTGSVAVGKIVAKAAAQHLTPVTLELGGKNPCIVDETANLQIAAKRIVWGKFINAGQTCIAPDYILVHQKSKAQFIQYLKEEITHAYGDNPEISPDYARIINAKNWSRLVGMLESDKVIFGGKYDSETNYLAPTLIDENNLDSLIMQDEIFGPLLPIVTYNNESEIDTIIAKYEKPLALYVFSERNNFCDTIISKHSFGGGCINDTMVHFSNNKLPFGGVGHSGIGAYHGQLSFDIFSHHKAVVKKATWIDLPLRYAPYKGKLTIVKKILNWL
ncbi:aldehyde dehydrogenase [Flavobacterium ammoniigenes]|jgi:aldehyde dehydrogenase (NAD+)|uniref:Aldehyde dehydrogenase n=1 Tax=Flavobacterium ammoniigenes TaxID=1751095 RepID=A0ABM7V6G2_9FLAO|nr:aldehyde dehydrogenase [Flavobacterium ammoniigenes]BDB55156.1 aldehyde dehydrogenase [Flavobacterium ammoniigenes]